MFDRICEAIGVNAEDVQLRNDCEHAVLKGLLRALQNNDIDLDDLKKLAQVYCELKKQDVAREKNAVALLVGEAKAEATARAAEAKIADAQSRSRRQREGDEPARRRERDREREETEAPFGRKPDGTPYTHAEFNVQLRKAVRDIYGIENFAPETANNP